MGIGEAMTGEGFVLAENYAGTTLLSDWIPWRTSSPTSLFDKCRRDQSPQAAVGSCWDSLPESTGRTPDSGFGGTRYPQRQ